MNKCEKEKRNFKKRLRKTRPRQPQYCKVMIMTSYKIKINFIIATNIYVFNQNTHNWIALLRQTEGLKSLSHYLLYEGVQTKRRGYRMKRLLSTKQSEICLILLLTIFVPTHLEGEGTIYSNGFFVQTILADRCIHCRELRPVSLESFSSVEYGIKNIFSISGFYRVLSRFKS